MFKRLCFLPGVFFFLAQDVAFNADLNILSGADLKLNERVLDEETNLKKVASSFFLKVFVLCVKCARQS